MTETASHSLQGSSSSNVVGVHYRVGKKIGEGSFGVIFQGSPVTPAVRRRSLMSVRGRRDEFTQFSDGCY